MTASKKWLKITFPCREKLTEAVSDLIGVLSGAGVEIQPDEQSGRNAISGFFALESDGDNPDTNEAHAIQSNVAEKVENLFCLYDETMPEFKTEIFDDQEWSTSWQKYFKTFEIVPGLIIKPSWETYAANEDQYLLEMDPGMAFGTGQHESTRLALSLLTYCIKGNSERIAHVLDVGTGTGILAMAAAVYGAVPIVAIDNDPEAVAVAEKNIRHNNLADRITVSMVPLTKITGKFDLICANIVHNVLIEMASDFSHLIAPGGFVVLAGILSGEQVQNIDAHYKRYGMYTLTERKEGKWSGMLLRHQT